MEKFIEKMKGKSERQKRYTAMILAAGFTLIIFVIWLVGFLSIY